MREFLPAQTCSNFRIAIDAKGMKVTAAYSLAPNTEPSGMAMDTKTRRLFVPTHSQSFLVLSADTGKILATLPMGAGNDAAKFDPGLNFGFASNGDGTLTILHEDGCDKFSLAQNVKTVLGARTMAVDSKTHRVFMPTADFAPPSPATPEKPNPRGAVIQGTFRVLALKSKYSHH